MYPANSEQAVKMRGLAARLRGEARETGNSFYCRILQYAALDLEGEAERIERDGWKPPRRPRRDARKRKRPRPC